MSRSRKRPLDVVPPPPPAAGQQVASVPETPRSPNKRLRRAGLVLMWLRPKITVEEMALMIRQVQMELARVCTFLMALVLQFGTIQTQLCEQRVFQRFLVDRLDVLQRTMEGMRRDQPELIQSAVPTEMQEMRAASISNGVHQHPGNPTICSRPQLNVVAIAEGLEQTGGRDRMVQLRFVNNNPENTQYTDSTVKWRSGGKVNVAIFENDNQITQGDLSKVEVDILAVHSEFFTKRRQENFTKEEFDKQICISGDKELVLATFNLKNGEGCLDSILFTVSSHRKEWRLAARVKSQVPRVRFEEAVTGPFVVKVGRSKMNAKSYPPEKEDDVHRLVGISPKGKFHDNLVGKGITKVKQLLRHYQIDGSALQELIGMKNEAWKDMIEHAKTCHPGKELYAYSAMGENYELLFNDFYDLVGVKHAGNTLHTLTLTTLNRVNNWKKSAHKNFEDLEKSKSLIPDYDMNDDGLLVPVSLNGDSNPSLQTRPISDHQTALREFGQQNPLLEQNRFSSVLVSSYDDAGPSTQAKQPLQQYACEQNMHQESGQQDHSLQLNENSNHLNQGNILNDHGCSAQLNTPSHSTVAAQEDDLIRGANLSVRHNEKLSSLTTDTAGTSNPVTVGVSQVNSLNEDDEFFQGLSPLLELFAQNHGHVAYQHVLTDNNETASSSSQFHGHEYDGGNWQ